MKRYLRNYCNYQQNDWFEWLSMIEFAFNAVIFVSIELFVFMINYGFESRMFFDSSTKINDESAKKRILTRKTSNIVSKMKDIWNFIKNVTGTPGSLSFLPGLLPSWTSQEGRRRTRLSVVLVSCSSLKNLDIHHISHHFVYHCCSIRDKKEVSECARKSETIRWSKKNILVWIQSWRHDMIVHKEHQNWTIIEKTES